MALFWRAMKGLSCCSLLCSQLKFYSLHCNGIQGNCFQILDESNLSCWNEVNTTAITNSHFVIFIFGQVNSFFSFFVCAQNSQFDCMWTTSGSGFAATLLERVPAVAFLARTLEWSGLVCTDSPRGVITRIVLGFRGAAFVNIWGKAVLYNSLKTR